jgi:hypothetical protein
MSGQNKNVSSPVLFEDVEISPARKFLLITAPRSPATETMAGTVPARRANAFQITGLGTLKVLCNSTIRSLVLLLVLQISKATKLTLSILSP